MQPNIQTIPQTGELSLSRNKVLRNTYFLLALSLIPTVIGAVLGTSMNFSWAAQHPAMFGVGSLVLMLGLMFGVSAARNSGLGVVLLLGFTFVMGVLLGPILQVALKMSNGAQVVGLAAGGTSAIFFVLAGIASNSKRDFSFMGKFLMVGIVLLIIASLANLFFQIPALALALSDRKSVV